MLKFVLKILFYLCAFVSVIMLLPGSILLDIKPKSFFHPLPKAFTGPIKFNERLSSADKLFENKILGPESLAVFNGKVVTGTADGFIYQIDGNNLKPLTKLVEKSCMLNPSNITKCGRPLGMTFTSKGVLYVVEPNVGVFTVDNIFGKTPKVNLVLDIDDTAVLGKASKFLDDVTVHEGAGLNGGDVIYVSDVSQNFDASECGLIIAGSDMGRLIKYDINAKKVESIAENLLLPNGVEITDDKNVVLVNEFVARQVIKVFIGGPKKGETAVLVKHLPGEPDNIRRSASKKETYWVAMFSARVQTKQNELDYYLKKPLLRKLVCRLSHMFGSVIEYIGNTVKMPLISEYGSGIKRGVYLMNYIFNDESNDKAMIIEVDINGNIVDNLSSTDKSLTRMSEVREVRINENETVLYLGSYMNSYLGKLTLKR